MNAVESFLRKYDAKQIMGEKIDETTGRIVPVLGIGYDEAPFVNSDNLIGIDMPLPESLGLTKLSAFLRSTGRNLSDIYIKSFRETAISMVMAANVKGESSPTVGMVAAKMASK